MLAEFVLTYRNAAAPVEGCEDLRVELQPEVLLRDQLLVPVLLDALAPVCEGLPERREHHVDDEVAREPLALLVLVREVGFDLVALVNVLDELVDSQAFVMGHRERLDAVGLDVYA